MSIFDKILAWLNQGKIEKPVQEINDEPTLNKTNPPMVNTITLSSDMKSLYLIDNGRAIEFNLTSSKGILVGTLNGQLTVATAADGSATDDKSEATAPPNNGDNNGRKGIKVATKNSQWTATYYATTQSLFFIGAIEIDLDEPNARGEDDPKPKAFGFNLKENVINIRRIGNAIGIEVLPK